MSLTSPPKMNGIIKREGDSTMKQFKMLLFSIPLCMMAGCVEENLDQKTFVPTVAEGEVPFGASVKLQETPATKTVYGEPTDYNDYNFLEINWLADQDQVRVYCPQASDNSVKSADYTVRALSEGDVTSYYLQKNADRAIQWGDLTQNHEFYSFYPITVEDGGSISGLQTNTTVTATIPVAQQRGSIQTRQDPASGETWKVVAPNMTYAMMVGSGTWTPGAEPNVTMTYEPIVLVLDVVVNAGETAYEVLGVSVRSDSQPIVGSFEYDVAVEGGNFKYTSPTSDSNTLAWVDCQEGGNALTLNPGEKLNVKFFLLPRNINASELTVSVLLENGQTLRQRLVPEGNSDVNLISGNIVKVRTPKLNPAQSSNWMSMIDDDVLFASQLSLPGSKHSYSYQMYDGEKNNYNPASDRMQTYQTRNISEQFDAGIRAFDIKLDYYNRKVVLYVGGQPTSITFESMLDEIQAKLDAVPSEFVIIAINYVARGSAQSWLNAVCDVVDTWSRRNPRTDNPDDGTTLNDGDTDYFREVVSTTTVGVMRHGIGIMIHCPSDLGSNPTTSSTNVNLIANYGTGLQNTHLSELDITSSRGQGHIILQDLQQLNNPTLDGYLTVGLCPYFITEDYHLEGASLDLIQTKMNLIDELFTESRANNATGGTQRTNNLYVNDVSGYCVVNDSDFLSTGYATSNYQEYDYHDLDLAHVGYLGWRSRNETIIDYGVIYKYTYQPGDNPTNPQEGETRFVSVSPDGRSRSEGGNNALAAQYLNEDVGDMIYDLVNEGRTPLGVVYMNFAGVDDVEFGGKSYHVSGVRLPSLIMSNNFRFALATSADTQAAGSYDNSGSSIE